MTTPATNSQAAAPEKSAQPRPEVILPTLFGEGYGNYQIQKTNFLVSFVLHSIALGLVIWSGMWVAEHHQQIKQQITEVFTPSEISPYTLKPAPDEAGGGGGGGDRDKLQAPKGGLPKQAFEQITPPAVVIRNNDPKLPVEPTVVVPPSIVLPNSAQMGDPMSKILGPASNGTGFGGGIGSGSGGGVGSGRGPGVGPGYGGGIGGGVYRVGGGVSAPRVLSSPDPEYSEEARKAKYQGTVVLWVVVGPDGRPHDIRVQRTLGMGLDEKAVDAVKSWRFEPARKDGQAVAVQINIEVNFRLY
ncbi:MAG TPA: energy transducer TonB [Terriglobales bacterium]|nr:energy transducer TonB [Terriglobales bacterium]